jgi:TPR repeat protein
LGVEKNINMAIKWYEKAAELGDVEAKMRLEILNQNIK